VNSRFKRSWVDIGCLVVALWSFQFDLPDFKGNFVADFAIGFGGMVVDLHVQHRSW